MAAPTGQARADGRWPDPFDDISLYFAPDTMNEVFELCEFTMGKFGTVAAAVNRVVDYFLTGINLQGESDDERKKYNEFLTNDLHLMTELSAIGKDYFRYGNVFVSLILPFDRFLVCPECASEYAFSKMKGRYKFTAADLSFIGKCPSDTCGREVRFKAVDRRSTDKTRVKIKRWPVKEMRVKEHPITHACAYFWRMPPRVIDAITEGDHFILENTPREYLEAVRDYHKNSQNLGGDFVFAFDRDHVYHLKAPVPSGIRMEGWGLPPILVHFSKIYYLQTLRRFDMAIAQDFIVPFRVMFPQASPGANGGADPLGMDNALRYVGMLKSMVAKHRADPTHIQIAPGPIGYQMFGGEAKTITPKDNIAYTTEELLNDMGVPAELFKGSLSVQSAPVALRLFERSWGPLVDGNNDLIAWLIKGFSTHFLWGEIDGHLESVTLADDVQRIALGLQSAAGNDISKTTAYRSLGINYMDEQQKIIDEQTAIQKMQEKAMQESQAAQQQSAMNNPTAGPGMAGSQVGATPGDINEQAKQTAQQMLYQMSDSQRTSELIKMKQSNPTLHAAVKQELENLRSAHSSQGQQMSIEQAKQQQAPGGPLQQPQQGAEV